MRPSFTPMSMAADPRLSGRRASRSTRSKSIAGALCYWPKPGTHVAVCVLAFIVFEGSAMLSRRRFSVLAALAAPGGARQAPWPSKPIRWIVKFPDPPARPTSCREPWPSISAAARPADRGGNKHRRGRRPVGADSVARRDGDTHRPSWMRAPRRTASAGLYKDVPRSAGRLHAYPPVGTFPSGLAVNGGSTITTVRAARSGARKPGRGHLWFRGNGTRNHLVGQLAARGRRKCSSHSLIVALGAGDERTFWAGRSPR